MLRNLIIDILTDEIKKEFTNIFSHKNENLVSTPENSSHNVVDLPIPRGTTMIDTTGPLFYSPKEQRILEFLAQHGPMKQSAIVKHFKDHPDPINDTTVRELLANLKHRRAISTGDDGYGVIR
jgi:hypothetical protein